MVKKTKVPSKAELFKMSRMDLLKIIKQLRDENKELRLTIRSKNITIREERIKRKRYWEWVKRYRELCGRLTDIEKVGGTKE